MSFCMQSDFCLMPSHEFYTGEAVLYNGTVHNNSLVSARVLLLSPALKMILMSTNIFKTCRIYETSPSTCVDIMQKAKLVNFLSEQHFSSLRKSNQFSLLGKGKRKYFFLSHSNIRAKNVTNCILSGTIFPP